MPIVYDHSFFRRTATGQLPKDGDTWEFLSECLIATQKNPDVKTNIKGALNAYLAGADPSPYLTELNTIFTQLADAMVTLPGSPFATSRIFLQNAQGAVRACSDPDEIGTTQNGRTEVIVAQTSVDTVAAAMRVSSTTGELNYCVACGSASYESNAIYPAYILRIAVTLN